jgi:hypothetical protein
MARLNEMNAEKEANVVAIALHQPHRRGNDSTWCENAVGRFCLEYGLSAEVYNAAHTYGDVRRRWRAAKGAPTMLRLSEGVGTGEGPSASTVADWTRRLASALHFCVAVAGAEGWLSAEMLIIDNADIPDRYHTGARNALAALATAMGEMPMQKRAFA